MKKYILALLGLILLVDTSNAQKLDLGKDTTFCSSVNSATVDTNYLGKNLRIIGGDTDIKYNWELNYTIGNKNYTAKDFLNNTTLPNPYLINKPEGNEWVKFVLTAEQNGNIYKDSINIRVSKFYFTLAEQLLWLSTGDSVLLQSSNIGGGIKPLKFLRWEPSTGIKDIYAFPTWCKQTLTSMGESIAYLSYFQDSVGCVAYDN